LHVRHRKDADLEAALRAAEAAVKAKLGYTIALTEKPLFDPNRVNPNGAMEAADGFANTATGDEEYPATPHGALDAVRGEKRSRDAFSDLDNDPMVDAAVREAELE